MYSTKNSYPQSGKKLQQSNSSVTIIHTTFLLQEVILRDNWLAEVTREFTLNNTFLTVAITITMNQAQLSVTIVFSQTPAHIASPWTWG